MHTMEILHYTPFGCALLKGKLTLLKENESILNKDEH